MAKCKNLYIGNFNFKHSLHIERCMAYTEKQAFFLLCSRIAKKMGVSARIVFDYFQGTNKYELKCEVKFEEVDDGFM